MHVGVRKAGEVIVIDLTGNLVLGDGEEMLDEVMAEVLAEGWKKIVLNLSKVQRLDSSGIGELVAGWKQARKVGASLKLVRLGDRVKHTLHLSQVLPLLEVYEQETEAIASFPA
ncbi:MAG TPA: STAS domain-containing protein [Thermoanaerobaculaceae bacterium]|nr:STAS domain-containing protein [Thermoanaerobaculaceae bacterium]HPS77823.1 STAS domain-containing protein [Thermoanaerobaculaceae bacterium]